MRFCCAVALLTVLSMTACNKNKTQVESRRPYSSDDPVAAERYFVAKRMPPVGPGAKSAGTTIHRYEAAISHLQEMAVYSTAAGKSVSAQRRLRIPWIRVFETRSGITLETLTLPFTTLKTARIAAAPYALMVSNAATEAQTASALGTWTPLGPTDAGGRARALVINPKEHDSQIMLLATVGGGIWRTVDGGATWVPVFDDKPTLSVSTLAMAPSDYKRVYAGTGEGFGNYDSMTGNGIYLTTDNGKTWAPLKETQDNANFVYVQKLAVSPSDPDRVYAATGTGVFVRFHVGGDWTRLDTTTGPLDASGINGCTDIAIQNRPRTAKDTTNYVFVTCGNLTPGTVFRFSDTNTPQLLEAVLTTKGRSSVAISPSQQSSVYVMAAVAQIEGNPDGPTGPGLEMVFRSDKEGSSGTWDRATNMNIQLNRMLLTNVDYAYNSKCKLEKGDDGKYYDAYFDQGWYDNALAVNPLNPKEVWAGGIDLFRSDDQAANWGIASYWRRTDHNGGSVVHADIHSIIFHPDYGNNHVLFVTTDGGVFRTDNANGTLGHDECGVAPSDAIQWKAFNSGLAATQFYSGAIFPDGGNYIGGTQDNGTFFGKDTADVRTQWTQILGGDGGTTLVDSFNTKNVYATLPPGATVQIYKSINGPEGDFEPATKNLLGHFLFVTPLAMDPHSSAILWTGGDQIFRTTNAATNWQAASKLLSADNYGSEDSGVVSAIAVSPFDSNIVLAGVNYDDDKKIGGWILRTDQALTADRYTLWPRYRPRRGWVSSIAFDPKDRNVVYATYSSFNSGENRGHIFRSSHSGSAPWELLDGPCDEMDSTNTEPCNNDPSSIPDIPSHTLVVDPDDSNRLWVGTDIGVFTSLDRGKSWKQENAGFRVPVGVLVLDSTHKALLAFTHGRGVWRVKVR